MKRFQLILSILLSLIFVVGIISLMDNYVGCGGFSQIEYQFTFKDSKGNLVPGVQLKVVNSKETVSYGYPISDYLEDNIPTSNHLGIMTFHHISVDPEFDVKWSRLFWAFDIQHIPPPQFTLHFYLNDKRIGSYSYNKSAFAFNKDATTTVTIPSNRFPKSPESLPPHLQIQNRELPEIFNFFLVKGEIKIP